jgi:hypothetical protein
MQAPTGAAPVPTAAWDCATPPPPERLAELRVLFCASTLKPRLAPVWPKAGVCCTDGRDCERPVAVECDGLKFCTQGCALANFKAALLEGRDWMNKKVWVVGGGWAGAKLRGTEFGKQSDAHAALRRHVKA